MWSVEMLAWAKANERFPWNEMTCAHAAAAGHLQVLRWAREHDCPWDYRVFEGAALGGRLEV